MNQLQEDMKLYIRQEIRAILDPKGKKPERTNLPMIHGPQINWWIRHL